MCGPSSFAHGPDLLESGTPRKILRNNVAVAKNYLTEDELYSLERIVSAYLDLAEDRAKRRIPMTMEDWVRRLDILLMADDRDILTNAGTITAEIAKAHAESEFERYRIIQDRLYESDFGRFLVVEQGAEALNEDEPAERGMTRL